MKEQPQYDAFAGHYKNYGTDDSVKTAFVQRWMETELPHDLRESVVVDVGTGAGRWTPTFQQRGAKLVVGVDQSRKMLEEVPGAPEIFERNRIDREMMHTRTGVVLLLGDATSIVSRLYGADVAFASFSLCVMEDPRAAIHAMHSVLKPGGTALISTNVFVDRSVAPTEENPVREVDFSASNGGVEMYGNDHRRKELRIVLHVPNADIPLVDKAQDISDYIVSPRHFRVEKATLFPNEGHFVDGRDDALNERYYGDVHPNVVSVVDTTAVLAHLCMKIVKR